MHQNLSLTIFRAILSSGAALVALSGCFEPAISEKLILDFKSPTAVELAVIIEVRPASELESAAVRERADRYRKELENQLDPWSRRFADLDPVSEKWAREMEARAVKHVARSAVVRPDSLQRFFNDTGLTLSLIEGSGWRELSIYPGTSTRASSRQRAEMKRQLDQWSELLTSYFAALSTLYRYLEQHPDRAAPALQEVLKEVIVDGDDASDLSMEEQELAGAVRSAMDPVSSTLAAENAQAHSLDELISLVYDPFPCELIVRVPGRILDSVGFDQIEEDELRVAPLRLWTQLEQLEQPWIRPDPLLVLVRALRNPQERVDPAGLAGEERLVVAVPSAKEIRETIEQRLVRSTLYRVRWQG